ncbi:MAG: hypothetical protein HRT38_08200 [Alteromonadaceae bacterium]|nr:hypothetical protein [Alteromonadaceae bacterium]
MIRRYLNIQKIRFGEDLTYEIKIPDNLMSQPILPMSLLTLVENAIKHGVEKNNGEGHISINARITAKNILQFSIIDNVGILKAVPYGTGLSNLNARLAVAYNNNAKFSINSIANVETCAKLEVSLDD